VVTPAYVPDAGDLVWLDFTPQAGREQAGRRPAAVLSPRQYNEKVGLAIVCPVTSQAKGYPFEVPVTGSGRIQGVILSDHLKSLDWRQRNATKAGKLPKGVLDQVLESIAILLRIV
jgi:mRNA interferase MazF